LLMVRRLCTVLPLTEHTAEDVGRLLARSRTSDVVDAAVIVAAIEHNTVVLTSDPQDLAKLTSAADYPVRLLTV
jgi:predicted nucleic acid-binding protein